MKTIRSFWPKQLQSLDACKPNRWSSIHLALALTSVIGSSVLVAGCGEKTEVVENDTQVAKKDDENSKPSEAEKDFQVIETPKIGVKSLKDRNKEKNGDSTGTGKNVRKTSLGSGEKAVDTPTGDGLTLSEKEAVRRIFDQVGDIRDVSPVVSIWLFDQSTSGGEMISAIKNALVEQTKGLKDGKENFHKVIVGGFMASVEVADEEPTDDPAKVEAELNKLGNEGEGEESIYGAVQKGIELAKSVKGSAGAEVIIVIASDEAAPPGDELEKLCADAKAGGAPIYFLGTAAPFGRQRNNPKGSMDIVRGPETLLQDYVEIELPNAGDTFVVFDSGFGPWSLERISRSSGGAFLAIRRPPSQFGFSSVFDEEWPSSSAMRFDATAMKKHAPAYVSSEEYNKLVQSNKAISALHNAAKLKRLNALRFPANSFSAANEQQLRQSLDNAQRESARLSPDIEQMYNVLKEGEADRNKLTIPRWQAAYDLAMGQVLANTVRVDGYNAMLAALKRGKNFTNPKFDTWTLIPADSIDAGSAFKTKSEQARNYLSRVVKDHPGTPWAYLAAEELKTPIGWAWKEEDINP